MKVSEKVPAAIYWLSGENFNMLIVDENSFLKVATHYFFLKSHNFILISIDPEINKF